MMVRDPRPGGLEPPIDGLESVVSPKSAISIAIFLPIIGSLLRRARDELNRHSQRHDNCCNRAFHARMTTKQPEARKIKRRGGGALLDEPELAGVLGGKRAHDQDLATGWGARRSDGSLRDCQLRCRSNRLYSLLQRNNAQMRAHNGRSTERNAPALFAVIERERGMSDGEQPSWCTIPSGF